MESRSQHIFSDEQLLDLLKEDNRMAFTTLYDRYWEKLYRSAHNVLCDEDAAKDVVQEVFLDIWKNRHNRKIVYFPAYSLQAVKFQIANCLRRGKLRDIHQQQLSRISFENTTEELMDFKELNSLLEKSLEGLPEKCRDVFYLSRVEQLSNGEIAARLNLSTRTVEWHISNALKHLRHVMDAVCTFLCIAFTL